MSQANPYPLRIDEEVMLALKEAAVEDGRSVNKEIEFIIRQFLKSRQNSEA